MLHIIIEAAAKRMLKKGGEQSEKDNFNRGIDTRTQRDWPVRLLYPAQLLRGSEVASLEINSTTGDIDFYGSCNEGTETRRTAKPDFQNR
jgi:hypothetical protein